MNSTSLPTEKLFAVYLGGLVAGCHIEMHDIRFVVGKTIEATVPTLLREWIGDKKSVHIDAYTELRRTEGFDISLSEKAARSKQKLYFVNLGGYDKNKFTEVHEAGVFVASDPDEAKMKAKSLLLRETVRQHQDDLFEVDDCVAIDRIGGFYVQLIPVAGKQTWTPLKPDWCGYRPIGR